MFADKAHPLRISGLPGLIGCPMKAVLLDVGLLKDESGEAADTGSLFHAYIANWHTNGQRAEAAITAGNARGKKEYPKADPEKAANWFQAYKADPRNINANLIGVEVPVEIAIPAAPHDPTGEPVYLRGTLDQIRQDEDGKRIWDAKTGRAMGVAMFDTYAFQLAGYTLAAAAYLGCDELAAPGIIRIQGYDTKGCDPSSAPPGVFYRSVLNWDRCVMLMGEVANVVADIRAGRVDVRPGFSCATICPARGIQTCLQLFERIPS